MPASTGPHSSTPSVEPDDGEPSGRGELMEGGATTAETGGLSIEVDGLRLRYGTTEVLHGVSFQVRQGEVLALLGPNGAGKTSTIEILEGFRMRSAGRVDVLGVDPARGTEPWRARMGIVLQSWRDHPKWRVRELLAFQGSLYAPYSTSSIHRPWEVDDLLAAVGLTEHADRPIVHPGKGTGSPVLWRDAGVVQWQRQRV